MDFFVRRFHARRLHRREFRNTLPAGVPTGFRHDEVPFTPPPGSGAGRTGCRLLHKETRSCVTSVPLKQRSYKGVNIARAWRQKGLGLLRSTPWDRGAISMSSTRFNERSFLPRVY